MPPDIPATTATTATEAWLHTKYFYNPIVSLPPPPHNCLAIDAHEDSWKYNRQTDTVSISLFTNDLNSVLGKERYVAL